jgi:hypothetical protein
MSNSGTLMTTVKVNKDWVVYELPDGREIRVMVVRSNGKIRLKSEAPRDINITAELDESFGNR